MNKASRTKLLFVSVLVVMIWIGSVLALNKSLKDTAEYVRPMDHHKYLFMARHGVGEFKIAPFCWRIGVPAFVSLFDHSSQERVFLFVSIFSLLTIGLALTLLVSDLDPRPNSVLPYFALLLFLCMGWLTKDGLMNPIVVDLPLVASITLSVLMFTRGNVLGFLLTCLLGALVKESMIIAPIALMFVPDKPTKRPWVFSGIVLSATVIAVVRYAIPCGNSDLEYVTSLDPTLSVVQLGVSTYDPLSLFRTIGLTRLIHVNLSDVNAYVIDSYGLVSLLAGLFTLYHERVNRLFLLVAVGLAFATTLFAVNIQRPMLAASTLLIFAVCCSDKIRNCVNLFRVEIGVVLLGQVVLSVFIQRMSATSFVQLLLVGTVVSFSMAYRLKYMLRESK